VPQKMVLKKKLHKAIAHARKQIGQRLELSPRKLKS